MISIQRELSEGEQPPHSPGGYQGNLELEVGGLLCSTPALWENFSDILEVYRPKLLHFSTLIHAFKQSVLYHQSPQFFANFLPPEVRDFWFAEVYKHGVVTIKDVSRLREGLLEVLKSQKVTDILNSLIESSQNILTFREALKESIPQLVSLVGEGERVVDGSKIPQILKDIADGKVVRTHPFPYLDKLFGFPVLIYNKDITVIAGRTGRGKTSMSLNLALSYLQEGKNVVYITTEMDEVALSTKFAALVTGIEWRFLYGKDFDAEIIRQASKEFAEFIAGKGFYIFHHPACTVSDIAYAISQSVAMYGSVDAVIVDYIQQVEGGRGFHRDDTRAQELARVIRALGNLSAEYNTAMIVVSQVNNQGEVKDARAIEERAALVVRLGMMDFDGFKKLIRSILKLPAAAVIPPAVERELFNKFKQVMDVEVKKNRYGAFEQILRFLKWHPGTGRIEGVLSYEEILEWCKKAMEV